MNKKKIPLDHEPEIEMLQFLLCKIIIICRNTFVQTKVSGSTGPEPWGSKVENEGNKIKEDFILDQ